MPPCCLFIPALLFPVPVILSLPTFVHPISPPINVFLLPNNCLPPQVIVCSFISVGWCSWLLPCKSANSITQSFHLTFSSYFSVDGMYDMNRVEQICQPSLPTHLQRYTLLLEKRFYFHGRHSRQCLETPLQLFKKLHLWSFNTTYDWQTIASFKKKRLQRRCADIPPSWGGPFLGPERAGCSPIQSYLAVSDPSSRKIYIDALRSSGLV